MNKYTQRILIANDVIQQIRAKTLIARRGYYNVDPDSVSDVKFGLGDNDDIQNAVCKLKECTVCAKGALLIAQIKRFDKVTLGHFAKACSFYGCESASSPLTRLFTPRQMAEMEYIFEGEHHSWNTSLKSHEYVKLNAFKEELCQRFTQGVNLYDGYGNADDVLIAIMEKIIDNDGRRIVL
jgi:hypothetical protein